MFTIGENEEKQQIPLLVAIHPSLSFSPAAVIENLMECLKTDFATYNVRFCQDCSVVVPFDRYSYYTWFTAVNGDSFQGPFFTLKEKYVLNIGFFENSITLTYPAQLGKSDESDDKIFNYQYCQDFKSEIRSFISNSYYERSLSNFIGELIADFIEEQSGESSS